jgi:methanogenic corrinoid protein MtbC1
LAIAQSCWSPDAEWHSRPCADQAVALHVELGGGLAGPPSAPESNISPELLETLETELIPRLVLAHRGKSPDPARCADARRPPTAREQLQLAELAVAQDLEGALALIDKLGHAGLSLESILMDLVSPAARLLGTQWLDDTRSFTQVSMGLVLLQQVVHALGPRFAPSGSERGMVLLAPAPGEQHTLGLCLTGEFLRRAGWGVLVVTELSEADLIEVIAAERVDVLGLSVSNDLLLLPLTRFLARLRRVTRDRMPAVMLGGSIDPPVLGTFAAANRIEHCSTNPHDAVRYLDAHASLRLPSR